ADIFYNEFDASPSWRAANDGRPHRLTGTGIYELPFGKGRSFLRDGWASRLMGGFQLAATYEYSPGQLIDFGNLFYYGNDVSEINSGESTLGRWFNTDNFERAAARAPGTFHRRVFPTRVDDVRADSTTLWNANIQRNFRIGERLILEARMDALNLQNRSVFNPPNTNPVSTDFGKVLAQSSTMNRFIQLQVKIRF
ncbi:MAG: hypothetical protein ABIZ80_13445, partial [Bryobacteraceae bacterium]